MSFQTLVALTHAAELTLWKQDPLPCLLVPRPLGIVTPPVDSLPRLLFHGPASVPWDLALGGTGSACQEWEAVTTDPTLWK